METQSPFEQFDELRIDSIGKSFLSETAKWASFLAIIGYIGVGFMVLVAIIILLFGASMSSYNSMMPLGGGVFLALFYLIFAALYFFPIHYLYRFSSNMKEALRINNQTHLTKSFEQLKSHYKFIGILTIILISFYILAIFGLMVSGFNNLR